MGFCMTPAVVEALRGGAAKEEQSSWGLRMSTFSNSIAQLLGRRGRRISKNGVNE